jgi:hypothetical protein
MNRYVLAMGGPLATPARPLRPVSSVSSQGDVVIKIRRISVNEPSVSQARHCGGKT